ncbi:hypothetical protein [Streptacidiphilus anmyonensis]|uniref:hypothetical protein n=1 Tax=Streptacidiphilus anmyonensis TaxID=405782 RepID=UPI000AD7863A|nr:hypothetical protein [Streptacidiphilus anmyonensis]
MRALRAELGVELGEARALYERIVSGTDAFTLPELELVARRLRAAGVEARAVRAARH